MTASRRENKAAPSVAPDRLPLVVWVIAVLFFGVGFGFASAAAPPKEAPAVMFRVKVSAVEPEQPVRILYTWGGHGLGGDPQGGEVQLLAPPVAKLLPTPGDKASVDDVTGVPDEFKSDPAAVDTIRSDADKLVYLKPRLWSRPMHLSAIAQGFVTFYVVGMKSGDAIKNVTLRFEFTLGGKVLHEFESTSDAGPRVCIVVGRDDPKTPQWAEQTTPLVEYVERRAKRMESLPWASMPVPKAITLITDCGGFPNRDCNSAVPAVEARSLRQLGINSLRGGFGSVSEPLQKLLPAGEKVRSTGVATGFAPRIDFPVDTRTRKPTSVPPGGGCPWNPGIEERARTQAAEAVKLMAGIEQDRLWVHTADEIGSIFGGAPEGRPHMSACPDCQAAFRRWLQSRGFKPSDFDCATWQDVKNIAYPDARLWNDVNTEKKAAEQAFQNTLPGVVAGSAEPIALKKEPGAIELEGDQPPPPPAPATAPAKPATTRKASAATKPDKTAAGKTDEADPENETPQEVSTPVAADSPGRKRLLAYSWEFDCYSTGHYYRPLRDACEAHNRAKQEALDRGDTANPIVKQPFIYTFALRTNSFLMGGSLIDFFDFYREADNAMVYEMSNRDPRVWHWDSYLCDVGRSLQLHLGRKFGVYVKPHRGAPIQRALAALSRGAEYLFWYTYGPDYNKGDCFSQSDATLVNTSKAAHLIGAAEPLLVGAEFSNAPKVAVVRAGCDAAQFEDGKWLVTALRHSHVPIDALDQRMLVTEDLSRYTVIYATGRTVHRESALALCAFVKAGGTLYLSAGALAEDEAGEPIKELQDVLGVTKRQPAELWCGHIRAYGATGLGTFTEASVVPKDNEGVAAADGKAWQFSPRVGREKLMPTSGATVTAKFTDGSPAMIVNRIGKGRACLSALYAGLEYAIEIHGKDFDMMKSFNAVKRTFIAGPAVESAPPAVSASAPIVEVIALTHAKSRQRSIVLLNWAYANRVITPQESLKIRIADAKGVTRVSSIWLKADLAIERDGDAIVVTYPKLDEADVLVLHSEK